MTVRGTTANMQFNWTPQTLSWRVLLPLTSFTLFLLGSSAVSLQLNAQHGFVIAVPNVTTGNLVFQYFPIIVSFIYGGLWSWVDLDSKRLAPWYTMLSGKMEASANRLQYPVDFGLVVPLKAARRKHWLVLMTSMSTLLVYWAVTPLLGSLYVVRRSEVTSNILVTPFSDLSASQDFPSASISRTLLFEALNIEYFNQSLPSFITRDSAFIPYHIPGGASIPEIDETLAYKTSRYTSDLHCWAPSNISITENAVGANMAFDDGRGCVVRNIPMFNISTGQNRTFEAWYLGWHFDDRIDYALSSASCSEFASHRFLAIMTGNATDTLTFEHSNKSIALFCETEYLQQEVEVVVSMSDQSIVSYRPILAPEPLREGVFNVTLFEYILSTGWTPEISAGLERSDVAETTDLSLDALLLDKDIKDGSGNMVPFGMGALNLSTDQYFNATVLHQAYKAAHQLLFAVAIRQVFQQAAPDGLVNEVATLTGRINAVSLEPTIAFILEAVLAVTIGLTVLIMFIYERQDTKLRKDPRSTWDIVDLLLTRTYDSGLRQTSTTAPSLEIPRSASGKSSSVDEVLCSPGTTQEVSGSQEGESPAKPSASLYPDRKANLVLALFASCNIATILVLSVLKQRSDHNKGLSLAPMSTFVEQLLINYIPTLLATVTEPVWIEFCRSESILLPYKVLSKRIAPASATLNLSYATRIPQAVLFPALRSRHFLLGALAFSAVLSNILAIAMNDLFSPSFVSRASEEITHALYRPAMRTGSFASSFRAGSVDDTLTLQTFTPYIQMSNLSASIVPLPPWLGTDSYFMPHNISASISPNTTYTIPTTSIGGSLTCNEHVQSGSGHTYNLTHAQNMSQIILSLSFPSEDPDEPPQTCFPFYSSFLSSGEGAMDVGGDPFGSKTSELSIKLSVNSNDTLQDSFCSRRILLAWFRTNATLSGKASKPFDENGLSADINTSNATLHSSTQTIISCLPQSHSAPFNVTVSPDGHILNSIQTGPTKIEIQGELFRNVTNNMASLMTTAKINRPEYHTDTFGADWANYLMKLLRQNDDFLDVKQPPPNANEAMEAASAVYARLWATYASLLSKHFEVPSSGERIDVVGVRRDTVRRIFVSSTMFWIAIGILIWNVGVCCVLWVKTPSAFLPEAPVSLGAIMRLFEGSHCLEDFGKPGEKQDVEHEVLEKGEKMYAYGPFIGSDGKERVGIDRYPHAVPLNLRERRKVKGLWS